MKKILFILSWLLSLVVISVYVHENPEKIEIIKDYFNKNKIPTVKATEGEIQRSTGNSFIVEFSKVLSLSERTAFIVHDGNTSNFDENQQLWEDVSPSSDGVW